MMKPNVSVSFASLRLRFALVFLLSGCDSLGPIETIKTRNEPVGETSKSNLPFSDHGSQEFLTKITPSYAKKPELRFLRAPKLKDLEIPLQPEMNSIWGATGKDHLGRVYFGVSAWDGGKDPSAALWRYDPVKDQFEELGSIRQKLEELGLRRSIPFAETQIKIHSKIVQATDGRMYFSSQDEHQEDETGGRNPLFGGRLFALDPITDQWECILTAPEGLISIAARNRYVVAQGYFGHVLYQYDVVSKSIRSRKLGTFKGHVSRNIFMDRRMHVYGIRARIATQDEKIGIYNVGEASVRVSLVELDTELEEVQEWPLEDYLVTETTRSEGITGYCELRDGTIVFVTQTGALWKITIQDEIAKLERVGWIGGDSESFCGGLFAPFGDRFICGFTQRPSESARVWTVYDLDTAQANFLKLDRQSADLLSRPELLTYGTETLDHQTRAYVVGWRQVGGGKAPHVLQLSWE